MTWLEVLLSIVSTLLTGGLIVTIVTLKATKKEADAKAQQALAEAQSKELENTNAAIKIWREMAEQLSQKYDVVMDELDKLRKEVSRLNRINTRIVKLLDKITPENMEMIVEQIKQEIHDEKKDSIIAAVNAAVAGGGLQDS